MQKNVLVDTGSQSSVMDYSFLRSLQAGGKKVKILYRNALLTCANGSNLAVIGYSVLNLQIGTKSFRCKFSIVETMSPHVILGMNFLRQACMSVDPANGQVVLNSDGSMEKIPFISSSNSGNMKALSYAAKVRVQ